MIKVNTEGGMSFICAHCKKEYTQSNFNFAEPFKSLPENWYALYFRDRGVEFYCIKTECSALAQSYLDTLPARV